MKRPDFLATIGVSLATLLAVAACSNSSVGEPSTAAPTATSSTPDSGATSSANSTPDDPFGDMVACDVFDKALAKMDDWDFPSGKYDESGGDNGCRSTIPQKVSAGLTLQPGGTLEDFGDDPTKLYHGDIKGRRAVEERDGYEEGSCMLVMAVGSNARTLLGVTTSSMSRDEGCDLVEDIARNVEPLLPDEPS